jgi:hypothetical protein
MPLIECPACGRQISVEAEACPQCGHPNRLITPVRRGLPLPPTPPTPHGSAWPFTIVTAVIHTTLGFVLFLSLIVWTPRFEKFFKDFNIRWPSLTEWVMVVSRWMLSYWYVVIVPLGLLFAGNVLILYLLRSYPGSRRLGLHWYWFIAVTLLLLLAGGTVALAIWLPYIKVMEALPR